jgi:outer membrane biosynthesis protein TonB
LLVWLCTLALWPSSLRAECPVTATGVCTPGVEETIVEDIVETTEHGADGYTIITETTTTTTTTTVTTEDSGDILDGDNNFVSSTKEGDMDSDWGGQGPANMPSGNNCYGLGADKCAQITGSGNSTSTMGVPGMGTTFINTIDISSLDIENGGRTNYTIKIDKQDAQDRIYMHVTGRNGNTNVFSGTDILSESGVATGFAEYSGGWDFSGSITKIIVEVGGRDINLAIGPLFDDVSINVLYNVVNTIVNETITTVEMWVSMGGSTETEVIDIVENIFEHNDIVVDAPGDDMYFEPEFEETDMDMSYDTVEMEMEMEFDFEMDFEMPDMDFDMPDMNMDEMEVAVMDIEMEMEMEFEMEMDMEMPELDLPEPDMDMPEMDMPEPDMEMDMDMPETDMEMEEPAMEPEPMDEPESKPDMEEVKDEPVEENTEEPKEDVAEEPENKESVSEAEADEEQPEDMEEPEDKGEAKEKPVKKEVVKKEPEKKQEQKEKAAKKIVKKMGDKGRYDSTNQTKTLIVMQVLGDTKTFFETQQQLEDRVGFFTDMIIPDTKIEDNNMAGYFLFVGSEGLMNQIEESQWQQK